MCSSDLTITSRTALPRRNIRHDIAEAMRRNAKLQIEPTAQGLHRDSGWTAMGNSLKTPRERRARVWLVVAVVVCAVILAVTGLLTSGFGLIDSPGGTSDEQTAQERCESDVLSRLASPATAKLSNVKTASTALDPDSKDLFSLLDEPLKGVDHSRIAVLNASGVVDATNESGDTIHDPFSCRAYFVDGELVQTLVLFDHDH